MTIEYDHEKTYTETFTRTVGATTRTGVRGTLPQPSPSDANSIWLATNGSDGSAGTEAAPKLTLNGAIAALGGALTTVHIFRNSAVGDLDFVETLTSTLASTHNIQVEDGETATIEYTTGIRLNCSGSNTINGIHFLKQDSGATDTTEYIINCTSTVTIDNCTLECVSELVSGYYEYANSMNLTVVGGTYNINYSAFIGNTGIKSVQGLNANIDNCMFIYNGKNRTLEERRAGGLWLSHGAGGGAIVFDRCLFVNYISGHWYSDTSKKLCAVPILLDGSVDFWPSTAQDITLNSCHFFNTDTVIVEYGSFGSRADLVANNCHFSGLPFLQDSLGNILTSTALGANNVVTDTIESTLPPFFQFEQDGITNFTIESFRLQRANLTIPGGTDKYFLDSPLIGIGLSGVDINPFDESVSFLSSAFNKTIEIEYISQSMTIENIFANPVSLRDVNGNLHKGYDKERRRFTFVFGDGIHVSNTQMKELRDMLADNGSKRFYPLGVGGNVFNETGSSNGTFSDTDNSLSPVDATITPMVENYWRGFWVLMNTDYYYISENTTTKFILIDKLGNGFPANGSYSFLAEFILVNNEPVPYVYKQNNFSAFTRGGFLRESPEEVRNYDYTIDQFVLEEVEDEEENI